MRAIAAGTPFSDFGDLNSPDTFPFVQMTTFEPFGDPGGERSPGAPFSCVGVLNSPGTFPLIRMATFKPFGGLGRGEVSGSFFFRLLLI